MVIVLFLLGLFVGSFLGVLVDRIPRGEQFTGGRSYCESCGHALGALDLIPVVSFLFLRGKCRYCGVSLSAYYPAIEIGTGLLFALTLGSFTFVNSLELAFFLIIASAFIVILFSDIKYGIIPDQVVLTLTLVIAAWLVIFQKSLLFNHLLAGLGAFVVFLIIVLVSKGRGMGMGDVKLSFPLGLLLGFPLTVCCIYLAFLTGAAVSIILVLGGRKKLKGSTIPFGPFLITGALLCLYFEEKIISVFYKLFGF